MRTHIITTLVTTLTLTSALPAQAQQQDPNHDLTQQASSIAQQYAEPAADYASSLAAEEFTKFPEAANIISSNTGCEAPEPGLGLNPEELITQSSIISNFTSYFNPCQESDHAHYTVRRVLTMVGIPLAIITTIAAILAATGITSKLILPQIKLP